MAILIDGLNSRPFGDTESHDCTELAIQIRG